MNLTDGIVNLLIRTDCRGSMDRMRGLRCLALAHACREAGGDVAFATVEADATFPGRLRHEAIPLAQLPCPPGSEEDARQTVQFARQCHAPWVALDGYYFSPEYQQALKEAGLRLLVIDDDGGSDVSHADLVLNPNLGGEKIRYAFAGPAPAVLQGARFAPVRREFLRWREWRRAVPKVVRKVLLTCQTVDEGAAVRRVLQTLATMGVDDLEVIALAESDSPAYAGLAAATADSPVAVRLRPNIAAMPALVIWADLAIVIGALPPAEWLYLGMPTVVVPEDRAQRRLVDPLAARNVAFFLESVDRLDSPRVAERLGKIVTAEEHRNAMVRASRRLVDGEGAERVYMRMSGDRVRLTRTQFEDGEVLWKWVNEPAVRENSFRPEPISWESHLQWLLGKMHDPRSHMFVALDENDSPVGRIRFDASQNAVEISLTVAEPCRGIGYGRDMLRLGIARIFSTEGVDEIHALIKPHNMPSIRLFENVGFRKVGREMIREQEALHYVLWRTPSVERE